MRIKPISQDAAAVIAEHQQQIAALRRELSELKMENAVLRDQLAGKPDSMWWLQRKCDSQRAALDILNRRVVSQRFQLRTLNEMGRGLSAEEYRTARQAVENEALRERIDEEPVAV